MGPAKNDTTAPIFRGIKNVSPDYKNGYLQLGWDAAEDDSPVTYLIFFNSQSRITQFKEPAYYTRETSYITSDLDLSKNYYFAVKAVDVNNNIDDNEKQIYFKSGFKHKGVSEEVIEYENSIAIYYFSTLGGRLKNIILKDYKTMDGKGQVKLLYYPGKASSYYYPLDVKILSKNDRYELLKFNDQNYYDSKVVGNKIVFTGVHDNLQVIKEYNIPENDYHFQLCVKLKRGVGNNKVYDIIALKWQPALGPENVSDKYDQLENCFYAAGNLKKVRYKKKNYNNLIIKKEDHIKWVAFFNRYFVSAIIPEETFKIKELFFYSDGIKKIAGIISVIDNDKFKTEGIEYNYTIYAGPKLRDTFKNIGKLNTLKTTISSRSFPVIGKLSDKLGYLFLDILLFIYQIVRNYGLAIIIFTILIKIILYPLTHKQFESMVKMQKIQPIVSQVREQYKKDPQLMNKELMKVYKKHKVNPLGGCLPLLFQLPIFFAIWNMLQSSIELRTASFLWIKSLALPDTIGHLGSIPINPLPILMGATMMIQQGQTKTDSKQKSMMYFMPLIFLIFFWNMPSGLVLYWSVQNILSIVQQFIIKKHQKNEIGGAEK